MVMSSKTTAKRFLSLLLLLSMFLGSLSAPVGALESFSEEKPATKAGKDYTATINSLDRPAGSYSTHFHMGTDVTAENAL